MLSRKRLVRSRQPGQVEALASLEQLLLGLRLLAQPEQTDKPACRVVVELVAGVVRRQLLAVQAVLALPADDRRLALEELHARHAADEALAAGDEVVQVFVE